MRGPLRQLSSWSTRSTSSCSSSPSCRTLHRVEHSLHCELYSLLTANRTLGRPYPLGRSGIHTQLVHKEWPEPTARPEKNGRRGNLDLAVLHPEQLTTTGVEAFTNGRIRPVVAIEIGLNYDLGHLRA